MNSPQSITLKTGETPADITAKANQARFTRLLVTFVGLVGAFFVWRNYEPENATRFLEVLIGFLINIGEFLIDVLAFVVE